MPRLPLWRQTYPEIALEVIGTDTVIDLAAGNADVAIRYAFASPPGLAPSELLRDRFWPVASPKLLPGGKAIRRFSGAALCWREVVRNGGSGLIGPSPNGAA